MHARVPVTRKFIDLKDRHLASALCRASTAAPAQTRVASTSRTSVPRGSRNGIYGISRLLFSNHSGFAPESLMTFPHFSVSSAMSLPKSAGEPGRTAPPSGSNLTERTVLILRTLLASAHSAWFGDAAR